MKLLRRIPKMVLSSAITLCLVGPAYSQTISIIDSFPSPAGVPFGLACDGEYLWHSDRETKLIYKLSMDNASIVSSFQSPVDDPAGLVWDGEFLWCADWSNSSINKVDTTTQAVVHTFPWTHPFGVAWDGEFLWISSIFAQTISKVNPVTGGALSSFSTPGSVAGLDWYGAEIWAAVNDSIRRYTPATGQELGAFGLPAVLRGVTWCGGYLWVANNRSDKIYKIAAIYGSGDVNCDGAIDLTDVVLFGNHLDGLITLTGTCGEDKADIDTDGDIDEDDYNLLYDVVAGVGP